MIDQDELAQRLGEVGDELIQWLEEEGFTGFVELRVSAEGQGFDLEATHHGETFDLADAHQWGDVGEGAA